ncbi:MAG: hypothetical protein NTY77_20575 [Elusimicrobia bacterium]|nr:hypothetical protein [Elusimicrobiota bacterium]
MIILLFLVPLACVPLLGIECVRWHHRHGNHGVLRKAFWLAFSSSLLWSLLGDYVSVTYAGWSRLSYLLLPAGAVYTGVCAWKLYRKNQHKRRTALAVLAYVLIFNLTGRLIQASTWVEFREQVQSMGSLSRLRGPLH